MIDGTAKINTTSFRWTCPTPRRRGELRDLANGNSLMKHGVLMSAFDAKDGKVKWSGDEIHLSYLLNVYIGYIGDFGYRLIHIKHDKQME